MRRFLLCALVVACAAPAAHAAGDAASPVVIPVGDWTNVLANIALALVPIFIAWLVREIPAKYRQKLETEQNGQFMTQAETLLEQAISYGINAVAGAEKGKTLSVDIANPVLRQAVSYVVTHGASDLYAWLGGASGIEEKIISKLNVDPAASVVPGGQKSFVAADGSTSKGSAPASQISPASVLGAPAAPATESVS